MIKVAPAAVVSNLAIRVTVALSHVVNIFQAMAVVVNTIPVVVSLTLVEVAEATITRVLPVAAVKAAGKSTTTVFITTQDLRENDNETIETERNGFR